MKNKIGKLCVLFGVNYYVILTDIFLLSKLFYKCYFVVDVKYYFQTFIKFLEFTSHEAKVYLHISGLIH